MNRFLGRLRGEDGFTLLELIVATAILGVVMVIFTAVLASVQTAVGRETDRSASNDQARLAVEQLDREVRSANVLYDPALEGTQPGHTTDCLNWNTCPGMSLRVYTQSNAGQHNPGNRCVQWRITTAQQQNVNDTAWLPEVLQRRDWAVNWRDDPGTLVDGWRTVASDIKNRTLSPTVVAFTRDESNAKYGKRILKIVIMANDSAGAGQPVEVDASISGRDTEYGYPQTICDDIPPY
jgi:prepilin-type N-terminal cleavage/methylation domain-containing protein